MPPKFSFKVHTGETSSKTVKEPMPVSPEFDGRNSKRVKGQYDRSYWEVELLRRHPEIKDLIERTDPIERAANFAAMYMPNRRLLPQESVLSLISQHLKLLGLTQTATALDESFAFPIVHPPHHPKSQLVHHLEKGILNAEKFWSFLLPTPTFPTDPSAIKKLQVAQAQATLGVRGGRHQDNVAMKDEDIEKLKDLMVDETTKMPTKGTVNQIVYAAATRYRSFAQNFIDVFVMTYHGFMPSNMMFQKLKEVWELIGEQNANADDVMKDQSELLFVSLVEKWIEVSFFDFDGALLQNISQWLGQIKTNKPSTHKRMKDAIQKQIQGKQSDRMRQVAFDPHSVRVPENLFLSKFNLISVDIVELARQITMASAKYYYAISPKELLDCAWSKPSIKHRSPNIVALTNKFNVLGDWVMSEILDAPTIHQRLEVFSFFSLLAKELWDMCNFFDGMAIATSLNSNPIYRLKKHKAKLSPAIIDAVQHILDATKSDNNFAELLAIHDGAQAKGNALPYVGVYLTQLTFTYDGNHDFVDGLVNFSKCVGVSKVIDKILSFQTMQYNFIEIEQIQEKLRQLPRLDEGELFAKSLIIEPSKMTDEEFQAKYDAGE